jgi:hypothetical protein
MTNDQFRTRQIPSARKWADRCGHSDFVIRASAFVIAQRALDRG